VLTGEKGSQICRKVRMAGQQFFLVGLLTGIQGLKVSEHDILQAFVLLE
jgi:hypothetical protein